MSITERINKMFGRKTTEEKVDDGLKAFRDLAQGIGERDIAMQIDELIMFGSMEDKCTKILSLGILMPLLVMTNNLTESVDDL